MIRSGPHLLVVEDDLNDMKQLQELFRDVLPDAEVDAAASIKEAGDMLRATAQAGAPYDVIVLDHRLPLYRGGPDKPDVSVCRLAAQLMPDAVVAHITAYPDDAEFIRHVAAFHSDLNDPRTVVITKKGSGWARALRTRVARYLHNRRIDGELTELFGPPAERSYLGANRLRANRSRRMSSVTHRIGAIELDIREHWSDLDENIKVRVRQHFRVDESKTPIRVGLL